MIILGVLLPEAFCWFCVEFVLMTMPPDLAWEEAEDAPKMVEALTTRVTVGVVTLVAGAAFTPVLSRTIVGFCNLRFKTFKTTSKKKGIHQNGELTSNTRDIT